MTQALVFVFIFTLQFGLRNDFVIPENHKHTCMKTFEILLNILNFIYPWWIGVSISRTFERGRGSLCLHGFQTFFLKNRFLSDYVVSACPKYISGNLRDFLRIFFGIFQKISKVSKNIFWASCDHVVAQKPIFR